MEAAESAYRYSGEEADASGMEEVEWEIEPAEEVAAIGFERGFGTVRSEHSDSGSLTSEDSVRFDMSTLALLRVDKRPFPSMIPLMTPLSTLEERSEASTVSTTATSPRSSIHGNGSIQGAVHGATIRSQADEVPPFSARLVPYAPRSIQSTPTATPYKDFSEFWGRTEIHPQHGHTQLALNRVGPIEVVRPKHPVNHSFIPGISPEYPKNEAPPRVSTASVETLVSDDNQYHAEPNVHRVSFDSRPPVMSRKIGSAPVRTSISKPNISSPRRSSIYLHCDAIATKISKETAPLSKFLPFKTKVGEKAEKAVETRTSVSTLRSSASTVAASVASLDVDVQAKDETLSHPVSSTPHKSANSSDTRKCNGFKRFLEKTAQIFKFSAKRKEFIREPVPLQSTSDPHLAGQKFSIKSSTSSIAQPPSITLDDFTTTLAYDPAQHSIAPNMAPSINKPPSFHQQQQQQRTRSSAMSHHRDDVVIGTGLSLPRSFASTTACETPHISCSPRNSLQQSHNSSANHSCDSFGSPATRGSTGAPSGYNSSCSPSFGSALSTLHRPSAAVANTVYEDNYLVLGETMASLDRHRLAFRSAASSRRSAGSSSVRSVREGGKNALQDALGVSMAILSSDSGAASLSSGNGSGSVRWSGSESGNDGVGIPQTPDNTFIWREESVGEEPPMIRRSRSSPAVVVSIGGVENMKVAVGVELAKLYYDVCISELGVDEIAERMEAGEYVDHNAGSFSS